MGACQHPHLTRQWVEVLSLPGCPSSLPLDLKYLRSCIALPGQDEKAEMGLLAAVVPGTRRGSAGPSPQVPVAPFGAPGLATAPRQLEWLGAEHSIAALALTALSALLQVCKGAWLGPVCQSVSGCARGALLKENLA